MSPRPLNVTSVWEKHYLVVPENLKSEHMRRVSKSQVIVERYTSMYVKYGIPDTQLEA